MPFCHAASHSGGPDMTGVAAGLATGDAPWANPCPRRSVNPAAAPAPTTCRRVNRESRRMVRTPCVVTTALRFLLSVFSQGSDWGWPGQSACRSPGAPGVHANGSEDQDSLPFDASLSLDDDPAVHLHRPFGFRAATVQDAVVRVLTRFGERQLERLPNQPEHLVDLRRQGHESGVGVRRAVVLGTSRWQECHIVLEDLRRTGRLRLDQDVFRRFLAAEERDGMWFTV